MNYLLARVRDSTLFQYFMKKLIKLIFVLFSVFAIGCVLEDNFIASLFITSRMFSGAVRSY